MPSRDGRSEDTAPRVRRPPGFFGTLWRLGLVAVLLFGLAGALGYALVWKLAKTPETQVPDLLSLSAGEALQRASRDGYALRISASEPSSASNADLSPGTVLAQRPVPGEWSKPGAVITLTVVAGDESISTAD